MMHRFIVALALAGTLLGVGVSHVWAQAPPGETPPVDLPTLTPQQLVPRADDAAGRALRSLYVPDGLSADEAVRQVVATSPDMRKVKALVRQAKGGALRAMSGLVPVLELIGRYTRLSPVDNPTFEIPTLGRLSFPSLTQQFASDATLIYSFTDSLAEALPAHRAAKKSKVAARYQIEAETNNVRFAGREAYYEYARAEAGLAVANFALDAAESQRKETAAQVGAGTAARVDLLRVQAQEEAARVAVEQAKFGVQVAARALQTLMHTKELPSLGEDLSAPVTEVPSETEDELLAYAYEHRPDLMAVRKYVEITQHQLKSARGSAAPDVLARGSVQYSNPNLRVVPQQQRFEATWEVSAVVRWAFNDTIEGTGRARELQAELQQAYADVTLMQDAIRVDVAQGYNGMLAARSAIGSARLGLESAREGYRVTREQLQAGIVNTTTLLQAQAELIRAQVDVVESAIGVRIAKAQLRRAIGERP
jgi:outer membrane protein TolC